VVSLLLFTACSSLVLFPTNELVQKAIALQLEQTQQQINQQLTLDLEKFEIKQLAVTQQQFLRIENLPAFRVQGTYDLIAKLPNRGLTQLQKSFDLYLQIQKEGKSWRLLLPEKSDPTTQTIWRGYLVL
jgi:hypothetical protein